MVSRKIIKLKNYKINSEFGIKKINDNFANAFNYTEDKSVEFFSDFNGFRVVMKNLNYDFIKNLNNRESTIKAEIKKRKILEVQIQKIMEFFETNDELTRLDVEILLDVKKSRARDLIIFSQKSLFFKYLKQFVYIIFRRFLYI